MYVFHWRLLKFNQSYCSCKGAIKFHYCFSTETNSSAQVSWFKDLSLELLCASFLSLCGCQVQFMLTEVFLLGLKAIKTVKS